MQQLDHKPFKWYQEQKFSNPLIQKQYEEFVAEGSLKSLKVALFCILLYTLLTITRDAVFPPPDSMLGFKQILRSVVIILTGVTLAYLFTQNEITPRAQRSIADATAVLSAFLSWLVLANDGLEFTEELLGRYITITSVTMIVIAAVLRCTTSITIIVLTALYFSPINLALPLVDTFPAAIIRNGIFITISFGLAVFLHLSLGAKDFRLFQALCETRQSLLLVTRANQSKRMFFAAIAHDYRQPLSALQTYVDLGVSLNREGPNQQLQHVMGKIQESTSMIVQNLSSLLELTALDQATENIKTETVDLEKTVRKVIEIYQPAAEQSEIKIELELRGRAFFGKTNETLFIQILANLIGNSLKHHRNTPSRRVVRVSLTQTETQTRCAVIDNGKGQLNAWDRLEAKPSTGTSGFGLEIIKNALLALTDHSLKVRSRSKRYTSVIIRVPSVLTD
jgi:signal transduction histidine kinase